MTLELYSTLSSLAVRLVQLLIGSKKFLLWRLFLLFFICHPHLFYSLSDELDDSDVEEYDNIGSESGSAGMLGTGLVGVLRGVVLTLGVTLSAEKSCNGDGG